ncbi:MAG: outer membrane beta-barrel protein [Capnocytophaga sp.]|nr:outer membrane beta-barrel protein [Capnocytophaga sp.]
MYAFGASWNKKYANKRQFSLGTRLSLVDNKDYFDYIDILGGQRIKNTNFSNDFFLKEYILAAFSRYNFPVGKKSSVALGVRLEYNYNDFTNTLVSYDNNNTRLLFNAQYNTTLWNKNFYISVAQRLSRANYNLFNPTYVITSATTAYTGNVDLKPTDFYQIQTGYKIGRVDVTLLYRYFENNILSIPSDRNGILTTRPENIGYQNNFYVGASTFYKINDWWEANLKLTGGYLDFKLPSERFASAYGYVQLFQRVYLPWQDMEIGIDYSGTSGYRWMYTRNYYNNSLNMSLFYPISKSFKLNVYANDIFNTSRSKSEYDYNNIYSYNYHKAHTQIFGVSLTYSFYKGKEVDDNTRNSGLEGEKSRLR